MLKDYLRTQPALAASVALRREAQLRLLRDFLMLVDDPAFTRGVDAWMRPRISAVYLLSEG